MKTVAARIVTGKRRQPALLSVDDESGDGVAVLIVEGVANAPDDLPTGSYLVVDDPEMADLAVLAGYVTEPPNTAKRQRRRILGRVYASGLLFGAVASLYWVVKALLALDLLGALVWVGLGLFTGALGLVWWFMGEDIGLEEDAQARVRSRAFWTAVKKAVGSGHRKR